VSLLLLSRAGSLEDPRALSWSSGSNWPAVWLAHKRTSRRCRSPVCISIGERKGQGPRLDTPLAA